MRTQGSNSKLVRVHNRALVLRTIQQHAPISRKEIAERIGLTQATISKITNDLIGRQLVVENDKSLPNEGFGPKPIGLSINREKYRVIAVYIGRASIQAAICDLSGCVIQKFEEFGNIFSDGGRPLETIVIEFLTRFVQSSGADMCGVLGIAISAPGPINSKQGIIHGTPVRPMKESDAPFDWRGISLADLVSQRFGLPVFTDNEANVAALGESWFGVGAGIDNFVLYSIGIGIGSGVIIDGMLYRGEDDVVSEIGHVTIDYKGPKCICGNVGCLELYAGFRKLVERYHSYGTKSGAIPQYDDTLSISKEIELVFRLSAAGDPAAVAAIEETANFLGIGAVSLANIFSPECIIIRGNDTGDADLSVLVPLLRESVRNGAFSVIANKVKVLMSGLGKDSWISGGVALVLQDFFSQPGSDGESS